MAKTNNVQTKTSTAARQIWIPVWTAYMIYVATLVLVIATVVNYYMPSIYMFVLQILSIIGLAVASIVLIISQTGKK